MRTVRAAVLHRPGERFRIERLVLQPPRQGEVRVRVEAAGVCRSDHHLATGATRHPMPVVCGHEGAGVIVQRGAGVTRLSDGDHVVFSWAPCCRECFYCARGLPAQCETMASTIWAGTMPDGSPRLSLDGRPVFHYCSLALFAEEAVVPESSCVPIGRDIPLDVAAVAGCAGTTGAGAVFHRSRPERGESIAIFGCGGVGMCAVAAAASAGAEPVIAVDIGRDRLELAREFGATAVVDASREDPVAAIRTLTGGRGADHSVEAIGNPAVMRSAIEAARPGGTVVLVGLEPQSEPIVLPPGGFTRSDKTIRSAYYGGCDPALEIPRLLDLHRRGRFPIDRLVTRRRPLSEINEAFDEMLAGRALRTVLRPS